MTQEMKDLSALELMTILNNKHDCSISIRVAQTAVDWMEGKIVVLRQEIEEYKSFQNFHNPEMDKLKQEAKEREEEIEKLAKALWQMSYAGYCLFGDGSWSMDEEPHFKKVYEDCGEILKGYQK